MGAKTVSGSGGERLGLRMDSSAPTMTTMTEPPLWTPLSSCSPASASPSLPGEQLGPACLHSALPVPP